MREFFCEMKHKSICVILEAYMFTIDDKKYGKMSYVRENNICAENFTVHKFYYSKILYLKLYSVVMKLECGIFRKLNYQC